MKYKDFSIEIIHSALKGSFSHSDFCNRVVRFALRDDFDRLQKETTFAEIYDLAVEYLDKNAERTKVWTQIVKCLGD